MNKTTGTGIESDQPIKPDLQQSTAWIQKAAEQGHAKAQFTLGKMYEEGEGESQDYQQAIIWYTKAAEQGDADAQFHLGQLYRKIPRAPVQTSEPDKEPVPTNLQGTDQPRLVSERLPSFFSKNRLAVMGLVGLIIVTVVMLSKPSNHPEQQANRRELPHPMVSTLSGGYGAIETASYVYEQNDLPADATPQWQDYQARNGENLTTIFNNLGLSTTTLYKVLDADTKNNLARLKPGQTIELLIDQDNILQQLKLRLNIKQTLLLERIDDSYIANTLTEGVEWQKKRYDGVINGSFSVSAHNAGIPADHIQKIANLFQWRVNFAKDLQKGDKFKVLVRQESVEGKSTGNTQLLGVEVFSKGKTLSAWLSKDGNYYDGLANSLERGFRRYPTHNRYPVSSSFNLVQTPPHEGTDFALPVGTAVMATGDGVVLKATRDTDRGVYVVIKHGRTLTTHYQHLSKLLVKPGQRVKMGDKIALSGNTGRTSGTYLHYEVRINDRPIDAMKVKLPMAEPLSGKEKRQFLAKVKSYRKEMNSEHVDVSENQSSTPAPAPIRPQPVQQPAAAHSISDAVCSSYENIMLNSILGFRERGVPVQAAMDVFRSERDFDTRSFLRGAVQFIYSDPETGRRILNNGQFLAACVKTHRGY